MSYTFSFASNFPGLVQANFDAAYLAVTTQFAGVSQLWATLEATIRDAKRALCYQYLTAWYLADMFPAEVSGVASDGGKPLTSKSIGGTSVTFKDIQVQPGMEQFTSNAFGVKAIGMLMSAPERYYIYN